MAQVKPPPSRSAKCYGYVRVSTSEQVKGDSLSVQRQQIAHHARRLNLKLERVFTDEGVSGGTPLEKRDQGRELLRMAQRGDTILAAKLDRLFRSASDALRVSEALKKRAIGLRLLDVMGGDDITTGDGMAQAFFRMAAVFANLERDRIGERIRDAKAEQRAKGEFLGGTATFGYTKGRDGKLHKVPLEQRAIAYIKRIRPKHSLRETAEMVKRHFPKLGPRSPSHPTIGQILVRR